MKPGCPTLQADSLSSEPPQKPIKETLVTKVKWHGNSWEFEEFLANFCNFSLLSIAMYCNLGMLTSSLRKILMLSSSVTYRTLYQTSLFGLFPAENMRQRLRGLAQLEQLLRAGGGERLLRLLESACPRPSMSSEFHFSLSLHRGTGIATCTCGKCRFP